MPVRTLFSSATFSFDPEGADVRSIALVVGLRARQSLQHLVLVRGNLAQGAGRARPVRVGEIAVNLK